MAADRRDLQALEEESVVLELGDLAYLDQPEEELRQRKR